MNSEISLTENGTRFKQALQYAQEKNYAAATAQFEQTDGFTGGISSLNKVKRLLAGEASLTDIHGVFVVGELSAEIAQAIEQSLAFFLSQGIKNSAGIILDVSESLHEFAATHQLMEDWHLVTLSKDNIQPSMIHEFAHCFFNTGNRFLAEAAAYYYETCYCEQYPQQVLKQIDNFNSFLDVRTLISYDAADDPFFEKLVPDQKFWVHAKGAIFFGRLLEQYDINQIQKLYAKLRGKLCSEHLQIMYRELSDTLDSILSDDSHNISVSSWKSSITLDMEYHYVTGETDELYPVYEEFFEQLLSGKYISQIEDETLIAIMAVALQKSAASDLTRAEAAVIIEQLTVTLATMERDNPRYFFFRSCLSVTQLMTGSDTIDQLMILEDAVNDLEKGLSIDPQDPVLLICLSRLEWYTPRELEERKGSLERSLHYMKRVAAMEKYAAAMEPQLQYYQQTA